MERSHSPHPVEDVSQVVLSLGGVRQPTIGSAVVVVSVDSTGPPRYDGSSRLLNGTNATKGPQVSVRDPRELLLDLLHVVSSDSLIRDKRTKEYTSGLSEQRTRDLEEKEFAAHKTVVSSVAGLGLEPHGSVVGTSSVVSGVVGSGRVPGETDEDRSQRAIYSTNGPQERDNASDFNSKRSCINHISASSDSPS